MRKRVFAGAFEGSVELFALPLDVAFGEIGRNFCPARPTDGDARERHGHEESIPGMQRQGAARLQMKRSDARAGESGELDGARLGAKNRAARAVGGQDRGTAGFDDALEAEQPFPCAARAGTAHCLVSEELESASDELAVEALADDDRRAGAAEVKRAGQNTLVPEAEDFSRCSGAEGKRRGSFFGDGFEAPGSADDREQRANEARNYSQRDALTERKLFAGCVGHFVDFKAQKG